MKIFKEPTGRYYGEYRWIINFWNLMIPVTRLTLKIFCLQLIQISIISLFWILILSIIRDIQK
jgi:hypothetical protein